MGFGIAKFRIAKFSHCEFDICEIFALRNWNWQCKFKIGIAKWNLALRNFALRNFRIAKLKLALRNGIWHCEISHCEIFALRIWVGEFSHCEMGLRNFRIAKWVCEQFAKISFLLIFHACLPVFNCISFSSLFLRFSIEFWAC